MSEKYQAVHPIIPRERLDFGLADADIPKYWFGGDPFKTRLFDAMSLIFPPGERFFMTCVRDFRDQITDRQLLEEIKGFNRQEAQHSMVHNQYNDRLRAQGVDVDGMMGWLEHLLFTKYRGSRSRGYTLASPVRWNTSPPLARTRCSTSATCSRRPTIASVPCTPGMPSKRSNTKAWPTT